MCCGRPWMTVVRSADGDGGVRESRLCIGVCAFDPLCARWWAVRVKSVRVRVRSFRTRPGVRGTRTSAPASTAWCVVAGAQAAS